MNRTPQSLRRRLVIQIGLMIVGLLMLSLGAIIGINGLHHDVGDALRGYQRLRAVYEIGLNVASARSSLNADSPNKVAAKSSLETALVKFDTGEPIGDPQLRRDIDAAIHTLDPAAIDSAIARLANLSAGIRTSIVTRQQAADQKRQLTLWVIISFSAVVVLAGIILGIRQYNGVMRPLRRLSEAVRRAATGTFDQHIDPRGDREFVILAQDFNRMASDLDALYRDLEQKVAAKSKELVRSERLASVGYLAAGVAHEINNPLSIITGYGERALQQLNRLGDDPSTERIRKALTVMCEEAFACKQITDRLLSLARQGSEKSEPVSLPALVDEVVAGVGTLAEYRDRKIILEIDSSDDLKIRAKDGELKQVILNLLINALEAVEPATGQVRISIHREEDQVELAVSDNGRGMNAQTLDRVFEPFFTHKRGAQEGRNGTGLGLSITHAIIADHGGTIRAESAGLSHGSRFIVLLPAAVKREAGHASC